MSPALPLLPSAHRDETKRVSCCRESVLLTVAKSPGCRLSQSAPGRHSPGFRPAIVLQAPDFSSVPRPLPQGPRPPEAVQQQQQQQPPGTCQTHESMGATQSPGARHLGVGPRKWRCPQQGLQVVLVRNPSPVWAALPLPADTRLSSSVIAFPSSLSQCSGLLSGPEGPCRQGWRVW